jgi:hypothetical protein
MKYPYTTVHDLLDIFAIYNDCKDWTMSFWNFTDQRHEVLAPVGFWVLCKQHWEDGKDELRDKDKCLRLMLRVTTSDDPHALKTMEQFETYVKAQLAICPLIEDAKIVVMRPDNKHDMKITFSGSSKPSKEIHYMIDYEDGYKQWKVKLNWYRIKFKCFLAKLPIIGKHITIN